MTAEKRELRSRYRRERAERFRSTSFLHLLDSPEFSSARCVTSYFSINDEPSTAELNRSLISKGVTVLLPRVSGSSLEWVAWDGNASSLQENRGLIEPLGLAIEDLSEIDVVMVPSLHIDRFGYRLGQGGGFYDRALPLLPGWKVGLVHSGEFAEDELPREPHDIRLSAVATPDKIIRFD